MKAEEIDENSHFTSSEKQPETELLGLSPVQQASAIATEATLVSIRVLPALPHKWASCHGGTSLLLGSLFRQGC
jgi:hypothetical protein